MRRRPPRSDWSGEVSGGYALGLFLLAVFAGFTLLVAGPWIGIDAYFNTRTAPQVVIPVLHVLDHIGQRALCIPIDLTVIYLIWRRNHRTRPLWVFILGTLALNFLVGVLKLWLARGQPGSMNPDFFVGGMAYPSGHSANVIFMYGIIPYLLARYTRVRARTLRLLAGLVVLLEICMVMVSLTEKWHWFGDLIGGVLIGGATLAFTSAADHAIPDSIFEDGFWAGVRRIPALLLRERRDYQLMR